MLTAYEMMTTEAAKIAAAGAVVRQELMKLKNQITEARDCEEERNAVVMSELAEQQATIDKLLALIEGRDEPQAEAPVAEGAPVTDDAAEKLAEAAE